MKFQVNMFNPKLEKWRDMEHLGESRYPLGGGRCLLVVLLGSNQLGVATQNHDMNIFPWFSMYIHIPIYIYI